MKTCVICISRNAHDTINEWIEHYLELGFTHIFLFDNNNYENRYQIENKQVSLIPYYGYPIQKFRHKIDSDPNSKGEWRQSVMSKIAYMMAYEQEFDWMLICDDDEYLDLKGNFNNINDFLEHYKEFDNLIFEWEIMNDSNYIYIADEPEGKLKDIYTHTHYIGVAYKSMHRIPDFLTILNYIRNKSTGFIHNIEFNKKAHLMKITEATMKHYKTYCMERYLRKKSTYGFDDNDEIKDKMLEYFRLNNRLTKEKCDAYVKLCGELGLTISESDKKIIEKINI